MADRDETAARLLAAAEKLVALRGIHGASSRAITLEAGQRHNSAIQYHFGGREGLLNAVWTRGSGAVEELRQERMINLGLDPAARDTWRLSELVDIYIRPFCRYLDSRTPSYWARFNEQALFDYPLIIVPRLADSLRPFGEAPMVGLLDIFRRLEHLAAGDDTTSEIRLSMVVRMVISSLASWEREVEVGPTALTAQDVGEQLVELAIACLSSDRQPPSEPDRATQ